MDSITKTTFFNEVKDFLNSDGIEFVKYKDGESLSGADYANLFRVIVQCMIGVCVQEQKPIEIESLCKVGFDVGSQNFVIEIDSEVQTKLRNNKSMICNDMILPVTKEDVIFMLNDSKRSEVF